MKIFLKNIRAICALLSGCAVLSFAQEVSAQSVNPKIDSMKMLLHASKTDTTHFRLHFQIAQLYLKDGFYDSQYVHADAALQLAEKISSPTMQQQKFKAGSLRLKGIYFRTQGEFEKAIPFYLEALKEFESLKDSNGIASTINSIGNAYLALKRYDEAFGYFLQARNIDHALNKPEKESADLINISNALLADGLMPDSVVEKALVYAKEAFALANQTADPTLIVRSAEAVATCLRDLKRYNESLTYQKQALQKAESSGLTFLIAEQQYQIAQLYHDMKQYDLSIEYGLKSEALITQHHFNEFYSHLYRILSSDYAEKNDFAKAYAYTKKLNETLDSTYKTEIAAQLKQFESEKKDKEISLLNKDKQLKEAEAVQQRQLKNVFIGGAVLLLLIVLGLINRYRVKQRTAKQLEEKNKIIEKEKQRAEQSEQFKSQFLANMSHEIRTPMNAVMGITDLLLDEPQSEKNLRYLSAIKHSSENLLVIINDVLDLSKMEAGKMELDHIPFHMSEILQSIEDTFRIKAEQKGLQFIIDTNQKIPSVFIGDPSRIIQILINIVGNAIKFTEKGSVVLEVKSEKSNEKKEMEDRSHVSRFTFQVADTGIGIEKEKLEKIFDSFTQAHAGDARHYGGTGLGLTISKNLVERMNGTLEVESDAGAGTVFSFTIPLEVADEEQLVQYQLQRDGFSADDLFGIKILLAEDNEHNQLVAVGTLRKSIEEVEVDVVKNGKEALKKLESNSYDLILMDIQMPEMDGYEATMQIRNPESEVLNHHIPIIALTASIIRTDIKKCLDAGMNSYIPKPFTRQQLLKEIGIVLHKNTSVATSMQKNSSLKKNFFPNEKGVVNMSRLHNMCSNDEEKMVEYLHQFLKLIPVRINLMKSFLSDDERGNIILQAHKMKPQLSFFGMKTEEQLVTLIELKANTLSIDELQRIIKELEQGCSAAAEKIEAELKRIS